MNRIYDPKVRVNMKLIDSNLRRWPFLVSPLGIALVGKGIKLKSIQI